MTEGADRNRDRELLESVTEEAREVLPAPQGHPRFPLFDALRAIAAISILLVRITAFSGGYGGYKILFGDLDIGVPFLFLLSGFLLYRPFVASRQRGLPAPGLVAYARNRFFRIAPAYWVALTVTAIVPGLYGAFTGNWWAVLPPPSELSDVHARRLVRDGSPPLHRPADVDPRGRSRLLRRFAVLRGRDGSTAQASRSPPLARDRTHGARLLSVASFLIQATVADGGAPDWLFFSPLGRAWWFATGMGLGVISVGVSMRPSKARVIDWISGHPGTLWAGAGLIYVVMTLFILEPGPSLNAPTGSRGAYLLQYFLVGVIAILVVLPAIFGSGAPALPHRILEHPVPNWLGLVSYGIFLWHYPRGRLLDGPWSGRPSGRRPVSFPDGGYTFAHDPPCRAELLHR